MYRYSIRIGTYTEEMRPQTSNRVFAHIGRQLADHRTETKDTDLNVGIRYPRWNLPATNS